MASDDEDPGGQLPGPSDDDLSRPDGTSGPAGGTSDFASQFADVVRDFGTGITDTEEIRRQEVYAAAEHLWSLGMRLIPLHSWDGGRCSCGNEECQSPGKHPVEERWQEPALDPDSDRDWWRELTEGEISPIRWRPTSNIGIMTGAPSQVFVLDIDPPDGFTTLERLEAEHPDEPLPATLRVRTGRGGAHLYFRYPDFPVGNRKPWGKDAGLDIKGDRGQVVAPPSVSGFGPYSYVQDITSPNQISSAPSWILDVLRREYTLDNGEADGEDLPAVPDKQLRKWVESAIGGEAAAMRDAPQGSRNDMLNKSAFRLGSIGAHGLITQAEAWDALSDAAQAAGLGAREVRMTFASGWYSGLLKPADLSEVGGENYKWQRYTRDDFGLGDRLVQYFGTQLRYVEERGSWFSYAGGTWRRCSQAEPERLAQEMIRKLPVLEGELYPDEVPPGAESSPRTRFLAWVRRHRNRSAIVTAVMIARDRPAIRLPADLFDQSPFMLNLRNGVFDAETGDFKRGHDASQLLTMQAGVAFDDKARCKQWDAFLARVMPDEEMRRYLYRAWGYSLTSNVGERAFFLHHGPTAGGKSVMNNVITRISGGYAQTVPSESLLLTGVTGAVPTDIARMVGKRYLSASETRAGKQLNDSLVKQLTGGDPMAARFMRQDFFEFKPTGKIHIISNYRIHLANDSATEDRFHPIPWEVSIPKHQRDKTLADRIIENEAPGVLNRLLEGLADWRSRGLDPPPKAIAHKAEYLLAEDWRMRFVEDECTIIDPPKAGVVGRSTTELYDRYVQWLRRVNPGAKPLSENNFSTQLNEKFERVRTTLPDRSSWRGFPGLEIKPFMGI